MCTFFHLPFFEALATACKNSAGVGIAIAVSCTVDNWALSPLRRELSPFPPVSDLLTTIGSFGSPEYGDHRNMEIITR